MRRTVAFASCALLLALAGCGSVPAGIGAGAPPAPATTPSSVSITVTSEASAEASTAPTTTAAAPKPGAAAASWYKGGGEELITTLTGDIAAVTTDDRSHDSSSVMIDCVQLAADYTPAKANPVPPDAKASKYWEAALTELHAGYWDCNGGYSDNKTSEVRKGVDEIEGATTDLAAVKQRISALDG